MEFSEDSEAQYHFYGAIKNYPCSKSVLEAERYFECPCALETSDCQFLPCLQMEPLFRERGKNIRMHSKSETSGFCQNVVEAVCVRDSKQSSPTY